MRHQATETAYTRLLDRRARNVIREQADRAVGPDYRLLASTPLQRQYLATVAEIEEAPGEGVRYLAATVVQRAYLAQVIKVEDGPVAASLRLLLDLDDIEEDVSAGQSLAGRTSAESALVNTSVGHVLVRMRQLQQTRGPPWRPP